ncbi:hypothetical protein GCM10010413_41620 [Promicromonospora sukumoe]
MRFYPVIPPENSVISGPMTGQKRTLSGARCPVPGARRMLRLLRLLRLLREASRGWSAVVEPACPSSGKVRFYPVIGPGTSLMSGPMTGQKRTLSSAGGECLLCEVPAVRRVRGAEVPGMRRFRCARCPWGGQHCGGGGRVGRISFDWDPRNLAQADCPAEANRPGSGWPKSSPRGHPPFYCTRCDGEPARTGHGCLGSSRVGLVSART